MSPIKVAGRRKGVHPGVLLAILIGLTLAAAAVGLTLRQERQKNIDVARSLDIKGPPCAILTPEVFAARGFKLRHKHEYAGVEFERSAGAVACQDAAADGGTSANVVTHVCQFTSPTGIKATLNGKAVFYDISGGQPATITVEDGAMRCVMAANFKIG
jgi:hypothetical protein